jgi:glycosyltransferase involved in cell wall biosynthesis
MHTRTFSVTAHAGRPGTQRPGARFERGRDGHATRAMEVFEDVSLLQEEYSNRPSTVAITRSASPELSIVIPTLNEAANLPFVLSTIAAIDAEVIVVDGRSRDDTIRVAQSLRSDVRVIRERRPGKGAALQAGFEAATGDIIVMLDADGSADGREIPRFVEALMGGADFAKGTRFALGGGSVDITWLRRTGNKALTRLVNLSFGAGFTDLCYGYNAFWRDCLPYLDVDCDGFEVETLLNVRAVRGGLRVVEVPSYETGRIHGASNLRALPDGWRVLKVILRERRRKLDVHDAPVPGRARMNTRWPQ